jgi:mannitol/fructose-specific phosphotransferase system IIA component (Ntr-type)
MFLKGHTKHDALIELIGVFKKGDGITSYNEIKEKVFAREDLMSTGIGLGIGVPHVRMDALAAPLIAVGIQPQGIIDYHSMDNQPVKIIAMILVNNDQYKEYVKLLAEVVTVLKDEGRRTMVINGKSANEVLDVFVSAVDPKPSS